MAISKDNLLEFVKKIYPNVETYEHRGQLSLIIDKESIIEIGKALKSSDEFSFDMLMDITAIDWLDKKEKRFELVYFLYSNKNKYRLRLKLALAEDDLSVPTITDVWNSANWYERETYDMFGVKFEDHPGLRRFYMPEDYVDPITKEPIYPLRKDFPLMGVKDSLPLPPFPERDGELV